MYRQLQSADLQALHTSPLTDSNRRPPTVRMPAVGLRVGPRASGRAGGPTWRVGVWGVRGSGGGLEDDVVAERFELFDEPAGSVFG